MTADGRRWRVGGASAAAAMATMVLCGVSPSHAFLAAGHTVFSSQQTCCRNSRCSSTAMSTERDLTSPAVMAAAAEVNEPADEAAGSSSPTMISTASDTLSAKGSAATEAGRRWIKEMKAGDKVIGYVADTTKFAAFVDCSVVRRGAKDKIVPVTGFLHLTDIKLPYALEGTPRVNECEVEVKRGIHLTTYVKDVFPNAGRMTLSLDPNINKDKVLKLRNSKRQRSRNNRRERLRKKGQQPAVGDVVEGHVRKVEDSMLLVDVLFPELSVLRANKIRRSGEGGKFVNLSEKAKPGDVITVRIESIGASKRKGAEDDKATIDFVSWGGLGATQTSTAQDRGLDDEPGQASFDLAAEIDALPAQSGCLMTRGERGGRGQGSAALPQHDVVRLPHPMRRREAGVAARGAATAGDGCAGWGTATKTGRRLAGQRRRRPARGFGSSTLSLPTAALASSLAALAFLADPAAAFQFKAPTQRHQQQEARHLRRQPQAAADPCRGSCDAPLLQGSFTGRLGRQARRAPRGSAESSTGAREAHAYAEAAASAAPPEVVAEEDRDADADWDRDRSLDVDSGPEGGGRSGTSTVSDFPRIVEALSCYKIVHGHLQMNPTFKVPPNAPWPEHLHGMDLGRVIHRLRSEQSTYMSQYPDRVQLLVDMGFEWDNTTAPDEWERIILGVEVFYRLNSHSRVPMRFVVPAEDPWPMQIWGHKLGTRIAQMRMTGRYLGQDEATADKRRTALEQFGFEWRLRVKDDEYEMDGTPEEFSIVCEGLSVYRQLGGSVPNMSPTWVVPNADPWPIKTRGFPLGAQVRLIRSRHKYAKDSQEKTDILLALDVPINPTVTSERIAGQWGGPTETRFDKLCNALATYVALYGHAQVPKNFEVPRESSWPEMTWGVKLGRSLDNIVAKGTFIKGYPDRQARLEALGFDTDPGGLRGFRELVKGGMSEKDAYAATQASIDFAKEQSPSGLPAIGSGDSGEVEMDSQKLLGNVVDSLKVRTKPQGQGGVGNQEAGVKTGLASSSAPVVDDEVVEDRAESSIAQPKWIDVDSAQDGDGGVDVDDEGGMDVKKTVVPSFMKTEFTDEDRRLATDQTDLRYWPHETHAHTVRRMIPQLGYLARGFDEPATLDGPIGTSMVSLPGVLTPLQWDPKRNKETDEYGYERDEDDFLDDDEERDDMESGGSGMIDRQRGRRLIPGCSTAASSLEWCTEEDRARIEEVGFEWDEFGDGFKWDDVVAGLTHYKTLYGELPDDDFQIPVDYEWPIELSGMQLGSICKQMRIGDIWAKHDPTRSKALKKLGFDWGDDDLYLYFQWPEVLVAFYSVIKLKGHLDLSPQYVIPHEDPWPLPLHGTPVGFYLNIIRAQKDLLIEHYPERYEILRGMDIMWNDPILVDWREEEEHLVYPWRSWGVVKRRDGEDDEDDDAPRMRVKLDPDFGLDGP
eukprot:g3634.t1